VEAQVARVSKVLLSMAEHIDAITREVEKAAQ